MSSGSAPRLAAPIVVEGRLWGVLLVHATPRAPAAHRHRGRGSRTSPSSSPPQSANAQVRLRKWGDSRTSRPCLRAGGHPGCVGGPPPQRSSRRVAEEVGLLLDVDDTRMYRYEGGRDGHGGGPTGGEPSAAVPAIGARLALDGDKRPIARPPDGALRTRSATTQPQSARSRRWPRALGLRFSGRRPDRRRRTGLGAVTVAASKADGAVCRRTANPGSRSFTELVATAISNIQGALGPCRVAARAPIVCRGRRGTPPGRPRPATTERSSAWCTRSSRSRWAGPSPCSKDVDSGRRLLGPRALDQAEAAMVELREARATAILPVGPHLGRATGWSRGACLAHAGPG